METIRNYIENMFAGLPKDESLLKAKEDLLAIMEERYSDLKQEGKTENEAVGEVISRFGNIDELLDELGVKVGEKNPDALHPTAEEAEGYIRHRKLFGLMTGLGVLSILVGVACLIALDSLLPALAGLSSELSGNIGLFAMFFFICIAITLFVVFGIGSEKYEKYQKQLVELPAGVKADMEKRYDRNRISLALSVSGGIALIILGICSVIAADAIFGDSSIYSACGAAVMLVLIGLGVLLMCRAGVVSDGYKHLLNLEKKVDQKESVAETVFNSIFWPMVVLVYLVWSFAFGGWAISWIVFPVGGIITGIVSTILKAVESK